MNYQNIAVSRDVQTLIGQKVVEKCRFVDDGFFKIFCCPNFYRLSALSSISRLSILTLNCAKIQLRSANGKDSLIIDLSKFSGYVYLKRLIELMFNYSGYCIKEIHFISLKDVDFDKLMGILQNLTGVKVLSLPYEFANRRSKKMEKLIQNNVNSLVALKHLTHPLVLPREMRERLVAIHTSTLRNGTLEREQDFFAFYTSGASLPSVLEPLAKNGVSMRIEVHRLNKPFRSAKTAFASHGCRSMNLLSKIVLLKFTSIILSAIESKSIHKLLTNLVKAHQIFPKLTNLEVEFKLLDAYPNNYSQITDIEENDVVSPMALDSLNLSEILIGWINSQTFPFKVFAKVCLSVDYVLSENENKNEMLERAMRETTLSLTGTRWAQIKWNNIGSYCFAREQIEINEQSKFEYSLDYRSSIYSQKSYTDDVLFNIGHSL
ncbi:hypothetical protein ACQ4LE_010432 [Meloidogyne hapla]|uniref:F-box domain-containing protein n=1 Tax=Meloidogyne hapla TaxID=6305 RepID=A0A1I8BLU8_MELHA